MDLQTGPNIFLQANAPGLGIAMLLLSLLGSAEFYLALIPAILWCHDKTLGLRLLFLCSASAVLNGILKLLFHAPRPYWISAEVKALASESSFGMPSAAAQVSLTFLGYIGARSRQARVWIVCAALVILVGIARLYLGVHFLTDVLAGWIVALAILLLFLRYENTAAAWFLQRTVPARILLGLWASAAVIALSGGILLGLGAWQVPAGWSGLALAQTQVAISPLSLRDTFLAAGLVFGAIAGAGISAEYLPFEIRGSRSRKMLRFFTGGLILALFWIALSAATKSPDPAGYGMTYIRSACAGIWITAGAPWVFVRLGLMDCRSTPAG